MRADHRKYEHQDRACPPIGRIKDPDPLKTVEVGLEPQ